MACEKKIGQFARKSVSWWHIHFSLILLDIWHGMFVLEWQVYKCKTPGKGTSNEYQCLLLKTCNCSILCEFKVNMDDQVKNHFADWMLVLEWHVYECKTQGKGTSNEYQRTLFKSCNRWILRKFKVNRDDQVYELLCWLVIDIGFWLFGCCRGCLR